ncbi:MAG: universal stress protein [Cryomorphaceae bacterium]|jgi:nucleotide-binding universal stress UspA family protein|nr:universal stress protein [Cryomorphaceae bacterium]
MSSNLYLVPHDFTPVGDVALKYAIHLSKHVNVEIRLLHVVASKSDAPKAIAKLDEIISKAEVHSGVTFSKSVREGSIFDQISSLAKKDGAQLIIMGTHGALGLQKLLGSNAMKVVTSSDTPFIILQKDTPIRDIKNIVVPIDLTKESLQIINNAGDLAAIFGAKVHVVGEKQHDESLSIKMKNRILIVKNQYEERKVPCIVELIPPGGSYSKKIIAYAQKNEIDMVAIAYHTESLLPQFDTFAQSLITNESKLPCLILKSKPASNLYF